MKVLFCGLGSIGVRHAKLLKKNYSDVDIIALRSMKGQNDNLDLGFIVKSVYSFEEAMSEDPKVAFITNPTSLHMELAIKLAKKGIHIFMEKPLSHNMDGVDELIAIVKEKELITLMGCNMRFHPILKKIKEIYNSDSYGKAISYKINCGSYLPDWRPWQDYRLSYSAKKELGGGVLLDLIHEIDYCYWIFGEFKEVSSFSGKLSSLEMETEDYADVLVQNQSGIGGTLHLDYYRPIPNREVEIIFEKAIVVANMIENTITVVTKEEKRVFQFEFNRDDMYEEQIIYFMECITSKVQTFNDINEGAKVLRYALSMKGK